MGNKRIFATVGILSAAGLVAAGMATASPASAAPGCTIMLGTNVQVQNTTGSVIIIDQEGAKNPTIINANQSHTFSVRNSDGLTLRVTKPLPNTANFVHVSNITIHGSDFNFEGRVDQTYQAGDVKKTESGEMFFSGYTHNEKRVHFNRDGVNSQVNIFKGDPSYRYVNWKFNSLPDTPMK